MLPLPSTVYAEARQRAQELRRQAIDDAFAAVARWLRRAFTRRPAARMEVQPCRS